MTSKSELETNNTLQDFLASNPEVKNKTTDKCYIISEPWGDDSIELQIPLDDSELAAHLNRLRLPPRFCAIWHKDTSDLEFIFGPVDADSPLLQRKFSFVFDGSEYLCEYGNVSSALENLAKVARPVAPPSETEHRNLIALRQFFAQREKIIAQRGNEVLATSFYLRNINVHEDKLPKLARHLNFYMRFFDGHSPQIVIYPESEEATSQDKVKLGSTKIPDRITARELNPHLLILWEGASQSDPVRRFIYSYQIVEYAGFYFIRDDIHRSVRRALMSPDLMSKLDDACRSLLDIVVEDKASDEQKIDNIIKQYVDPAVLWTVIEAKISSFNVDTTFEGGFVLPPIVKKGWGIDDFKLSWSPTVPHTLRKLRNSLIHAREQRHSKSIMPTRRNRRLLRPWAELMLSVASQIIAYEEL